MFNLHFISDDDSVANIQALLGADNEGANIIRTILIGTYSADAMMEVYLEGIGLIDGMGLFDLQPAM